MEKWNNFHQNDTGMVYFQPNASDRKQLRANGRKRFPFLQSWGTNLNNFQHTQIGSRRVRIVSLNKFPLSNPLAEHGFSWFWVFSSFWASLVVLALVGMSGKSKIFGCHWLIFFANFWICFVIVAAAPFCFSGVPGISNTSRIISPLGKARKKKQLCSLLEVFPTLRPPPYFFHIPFISFQKTPVGHSGNGWEMCGVAFVFLTILTNFWANWVISCPLSFLRGTRHLQYPQNNFPPWESPHNGTQPGLFLGIFLTFPIHCHPKNSREKVP